MGARAGGRFVSSAGLIGFVALLASSSLAGCSNRGDSVAVIGDSITSLDQPAMQQQLDGDYSLVISGNFGKTAEEVMAPATAVAAKEHDQAIINLGTNDVLKGVAVETSMATLEQMVGLFGSADCVHLVNINEHMVNPAGQPVTEAAQRYNEGLEHLADGDDRLSIVDWNAEASGSLNDQTPPTSTLTGDSVHPTAEGNERLNELYVEALDSCDNPLDF